MKVGCPCPGEREAVPTERGREAASTLPCCVGRGLGHGQKQRGEPGHVITGFINYVKGWLYLETRKHWGCSKLSLTFKKIVSVSSLGDFLFPTPTFILNDFGLNPISLPPSSQLWGVTWPVAVVTLRFSVCTGRWCQGLLTWGVGSFWRPCGMWLQPHMVLVTCPCILMRRFHSKMWRMNHAMTQIFSGAS